MTAEWDDGYNTALMHVRDALQDMKLQGLSEMLDEHECLPHGMYISPGSGSDE